MNSNSIRKLLSVFVALLIIGNIATIAFFWLKKEEGIPPLKGGPAKFIIESLSFNDQQKRQFMDMANEHQRAIRPYRSELREAKDQLFALLKNPKTSQAKKLEAVKTVSIYTEKIDLITYNHFAQVRSICTPAQQEKFDAIIKQVIGMMAAPHPPGERPGPIGDPHGPPEEHPFPPPPHQD